MTFTFSQALEAIAKGCSSAVNGIKERALPTPGKRKREDEAVGRDYGEADKKRARNKMREDKKVDLHREASVNPPSQYARAAPPPLAQETEPGLPTDHQSKLTPTALMHPMGPSAASEHYTPRPKTYQEQTPTPMHPGRLADRYKTVNIRGGVAKAAATPVPWQRRYPVWDRQTPAYSSLLEIRPQMRFTTFATRAQAEHFSMRPGSALWGMFNGAPLGEERHCRTSQNTEDLEEKETLRQMTTVAMQRAAGMKENHQCPGKLGLPTERQEEALGVKKWIETEREPALLPLRLAPAHSLDLSTARYELEQAREERRSELVREETRQLLLRCKELMGDKQARLMVRASVALGEATSSRSAAAEISKASMNAARKEAEGLKGMLSEVEFLEHQQNKLQHLREAQRARETAASTAKQRQEDAPSKRHWLPSAARVERPQTQPTQAAESDAVDLVTSDEDGQEGADTQQDGAASEVFEIGSSSEDDAGTQQESTFSQDEEELDGDEEAEKIRAKLENIGVHEKKHPPQFLPLTAKQRALYANAMDPRSNQTKEIRFIKSRNIGLTRQLLACLRPRTWLNDEVVNGFLGLLQERDTIWRGKDGIPECHFFTTFFFNKLYLDKQEYDYDSVARWTKPQKLKTSHQASDSILDCDRVIAPVHLAVHWTCAMADLQHKEFVYLDSMGGAEPGIMQSFRRYIADEYRNKKQQTVDTSSWPIKYLEDIPQQRNGCDCGVFALIFAEHLSRNAALEFQQEDMPYFRVMITAALMQLQAPREFC